MKNEFPSDHVRVAAEFPPPRRVTEHDDWFASRRRIIPGKQRSPKSRAGSEHAEIVPGYDFTQEGVAFHAQQKMGAHHLGKRRVLLAEVLELAPGEPLPLATLDRPVE